MVNRSMSAERTYIMIKPDGVQRNLIGEIIARFEKKGYKLAALKVSLLHTFRDFLVTEKWQIDYWAWLLVESWIYIQHTRGAGRDCPFGERPGNGVLDQMNEWRCIFIENPCIAALCRFCPIALSCNWVLWLPLSWACATRFVWSVQMARPERSHLEEHYADLKDKKFFPGLINYMVSINHHSSPMIAHRPLKYRPKPGLLCLLLKQFRNIDYSDNRHC